MALELVLDEVSLEIPPLFLPFRADGNEVAGAAGSDASGGTCCYRYIVTALDD